MTIHSDQAGGILTTSTVGGPDTSVKSDHDQVGANILRLARERSGPDFLMRRFDTVEFLDASSARRTVECHLSLEPFNDDTQWPLLNGELLLPLARLRRFGDDGESVRTTIAVSDETGARVPRLTKREERHLVFAGVWHAARHSLGREPEALTSAAIGAIVMGVDRPSSIDRCAPSDSQLIHDSSFRAVLLEAYERYYLIAPLKPDNYSRRVITYSYLEQPEFEPLKTRWYSRVLWPKPGPVARFEAPAASDCQSFHFELVAPPDVTLPPQSSKLCIKTPFNGGWRVESMDDDRSDRRAHLFWEGEGPIERAIVEARLLPATTGITWAMRAMVAFASLLILVAVALAWWGTTTRINSLDRSSIVTLFLLGPAVVTTMVAIRSKHGLSSRMSWGTKATVVLPTLALFAGSLSMVSTPQEVELLRVVWTACLIAAVLACVRTVNECLWLRRARGGTA